MLSLLVISALFVSFTGCRRHQGPAVKKHDILTVNNFNEPEYLDPTYISALYEATIAMDLFEGLVSYDPKDAHPVPAGASHWDISTDQKVYTFHLRKNALWSDGRPVTASDYIYAWERALNPKNGVTYAFAFYYMKNATAYNTGQLTDPSQLGFRALDPYTLEITLNEPTPFILAQMCYPVFYPVPRWAIEQHGPRWTRPENIVTNGPFKLKTWATNKEILVEKNPTYWDQEHVKLAGARFLPIEDKETGLRMYENGEIDLNLWLPEKKSAQLQGRPDLVTNPLFVTYMYLLNTKKAPFDDMRVRQAFAMSVDRKTLVNKYLQGVQSEQTHLVPPGVPGYQSPEGFDFNPAKARSLLAEAGYGEGKSFPKVSIKYNTDAQHQLIAQIIQQMWKENLGISVDLINEEWKTYTKSRDMGDYNICRRTWAGDYIDPNTFLEIFLGHSSHNSTGWVNSDFDQLLKKASQEANPQARFALLKKAEAIFLHESPVIPILVETKYFLARPYVKGVYGNLNDLHPLKEVSLDFEN